MEKFAQIAKRAAARKGGAAALKKLLPEVLPARKLRAIPDDRWLAEMTRRIFQAGFAWKVIDAKWDGFEAAFDGFDPARLSMMNDDDIARLMQDTRIVRNGQKIASVRENAAFVMALRKEHGSAGAFFADWPGEDIIGLLEVLKKRGSRLGGNTGQIFLRFMGRDSFVLTTDVCAALVRAGVVAKPPSSKKDLAAVQAAFNAWAAESGLPLSHISRTLALSVGD